MVPPKTMFMGGSLLMRITRTASEYPAYPARSPGSELLPLRFRERPGQTAWVKRRHFDRLLERGERDGGSPMNAISQDRFQLCNAVPQVSGHRFRFSLAILKVEPLTFPLISDRLPYCGTLGLVASAGLLTRRSSMGTSRLKTLAASNP
jgi:hypothetical protein